MYLMVLVRYVADVLNQLNGHIVDADGLSFWPSNTVERHAIFDAQHRAT